ncbi:hypothetical protein [Acinetobacter cumulans]|nr:hypothetical protein [Acinetobacter cumulans]
MRSVDEYNQIINLGGCSSALFFILGKYLLGANEMIEKVENLLGLTIVGVEILIEELQKQFDQFVIDPIHETLGLSLEESGVAIELKTKNKRYSYNLEQLKLLKAEMLDPTMNSIKEIS